MSPIRRWRADDELHTATNSSMRNLRQRQAHHKTRTLRAKSTSASELQKCGVETQVRFDTKVAAH